MPAPQIYKRTISFLPTPTEEELQVEEKRGVTGVYAAFLPLLAAIFWIIVVFVNEGVYGDRLALLDADIKDKKAEITSYKYLEEKHTELVLKVEALKDLIIRDFEPEHFFRDIEKSLAATQGANSEIYSYSRDESGAFTIEGRAGSFLDLAKIVEVFNSETKYSSVQVKGIYYNEEEDNVNFELNFLYYDLEGINAEQSPSV